MTQLRFSLLVALLFTSVQLSAATILSAEEADSASNEALQSEVALFKSIRDGITLSMALCEGNADCQPNVSEDELTRLLETLDRRIDGLAQRQLGGEDSALADLMVAYVDEREGYAEFLSNMTEVSLEEAVGEDLDEAELFGDDSGDAAPAAAAEEAPAEFNDLFADEDEDL